MNNTSRIRAIDAIKRKLVGHELSYEDSYAIMHEFSTGGLTDIFVAYFAAASFSAGYTDDELYNLTKAMVETGKKFTLKGIVADKHSIGGMPGTRASMIIVPIVAAAGYQIPKTSSRAITTPAGTADCMEVLAPVAIELEKAQAIVERIGCCIIWGGHLGIAPADDVIIRVEEPLSFESYDKVIISILAKKVAASSKYMVLDIPVGPSMKIRLVKDALRFRDAFTRIAQRFGIRVKADINFQYEPAGFGIGPNYETIDAVKVLAQTPDRSSDLEFKSIKLASEVLDLCFAADHRADDSLLVAEYLLKSGAAMKKFREIVKAQGGDGDFVIDRISVGNNKKEILAPHDGVVSGVNNFNITSLARLLGAPSDKLGGMVLQARMGQRIKKHDILLTMYTNSADKLREAVDTYTHMPVFELQV